MNDFTGASPATVDYRRKVAQALASMSIDASPVGHWTQALARPFAALAGGVVQSQSDADERKGLTSASGPTPAIGNPWGGVGRGRGGGGGGGRGDSKATAAAAKAWARILETDPTVATDETKATRAKGFIRSTYGDVPDEVFDPTFGQIFLDEPKRSVYDERAEAAKRYGLQEGSPEFRGYVLEGDIPAAEKPKPSGDITKVLPTLSRVAAEHPDRYAEAIGVLEASGYQVPDQLRDPRTAAAFADSKPEARSAPMSAIERKAILEADDTAQSSESAIGTLDKALDLNESAYSGFAPETRASIGAFFGMEGAEDTIELQNVVTQQALEQMKAIFGGNPTEGERQILLQLQGSVGQPTAVRKRVFENARAAAQRRLDFNRQQAEALRSGTYFSPGGGAMTPGTPAETGGTSRAVPTVDQIPEGALFRDKQDGRVYRMINGQPVPAEGGQ